MISTTSRQLKITRKESNLSAMERFIATIHMETSNLFWMYVLQRRGKWSLDRWAYIDRIALKHYCCELFSQHAQMRETERSKWTKIVSYCRYLWRMLSDTVLTAHSPFDLLVPDACKNSTADCFHCIITIMEYKPIESSDCQYKKFELTQELENSLWIRWVVLSI